MKITGIIPATACAVAMCALLAGCMENRVTVKVKSDGSGRIVVSRVFGKQAAEQIEAQFEQTKSMIEQMKKMSRGNLPDNMKVPTDPFFDEARLREDASSFGRRIVLEKAVPYNKNGARGYVAVYAFSNINDVSISLSSMVTQPMTSMERNFRSYGDDEDEESATGVPEDSYRFSLVRGATARLTITPPAMPDVQPISFDAAPADGKKAADAAEEEDPENMVYDDYGNYSGNMGRIGSMMRMRGGMGGYPYGMPGSELSEMRNMLAGGRICLAVEVAGTPVKAAGTQGPAAKNRIVLLDLNTTKLLELPDESLKKLESAGDEFDPSESPTGMIAALRKAPGVLFEAGKEIVVEFK